MIIYKQNLARVQEKLNKLIKRATKLGKAALSYEVLPATPVTIHTYDGPCYAPCLDSDHRQTFQQVDVVLTGEAPVIEGWKLLARVEHLQGSEQNLIHAVPGVELDATPFHTRRVCDHCQTNVRRNDTMLITDGTTVRQIGRNCLADYVRSPEFASQCIELGAWLRQAHDLLDEEREMRRYCEPEYKTLDVIAVASAVIRDYGYQKKDSFNEPTVNRVQDHFVSDSGDKAKVETSEADGIFAMQALAWLAQAEASSDYLRNLKLLCEQPTLLRKHFGLVVSLPCAYRRAHDELTAKTDKPSSQHVGQPKDKITATVKIEKIIAYESAYGFGDMIKMRDITGNLYVWFTSSLTRCETEVDGQIIQPIQEGDTCNLKGTVKGHDEYRNEKQTMVTRCKLSPKPELTTIAS